MYRAVKGAAKNNSEKQRTSQIYADSFATLVYCVFFQLKQKCLHCPFQKRPLERTCIYRWHPTTEVWQACIYRRHPTTEVWQAAGVEDQWECDHLDWYHQLPLEAAAVTYVEESCWLSCLLYARRLLGRVQ